MNINTCNTINNLLLTKSATQRLDESKCNYIKTNVLLHTPTCSLNTKIKAQEEILIDSQCTCINKNLSQNYYNEYVQNIGIKSNNIVKDVFEEKLRKTNEKNLENNNNCDLKNFNLKQTNKNLSNEDTLLYSLLNGHLDKPFTSIILSNNLEKKFNSSLESNQFLAKSSPQLFQKRKLNKNQKLGNKKNEKFNNLETQLKLLICADHNQEDNLQTFSSSSNSEGLSLSSICSRPSSICSSPISSKLICQTNKSLPKKKIKIKKPNLSISILNGLNVTSKLPSLVSLSTNAAAAAASILSAKLSSLSNSNLKTNCIVEQELKNQIKQNHNTNSINICNSSHKDLVFKNEPVLIEHNIIKKQLESPKSSILPIKFSVKNLNEKKTPSNDDLILLTETKCEKNQLNSFVDHELKIEEKKDDFEKTDKNQQMNNQAHVLKKVDVISKNVFNENKRTNIIYDKFYQNDNDNFMKKYNNGNQSINFDQNRYQKDDLPIIPLKASCQKTNNSFLDSFSKNDKSTLFIKKENQSCKDLKKNYEFEINSELKINDNKNNENLLNKYTQNISRSKSDVGQCPKKNFNSKLELDNSLKITSSNDALFVNEKKNNLLSLEPNLNKINELKQLNDLSIKTKLNSQKMMKNQLENEKNLINFDISSNFDKISKTSISNESKNLKTSSINNLTNLTLNNLSILNKSNSSIQFNLNETNLSKNNLPNNLISNISLSDQIKKTLNQKNLIPNLDPNLTSSINSVSLPFNALNSKKAFNFEKNKTNLIDQEFDNGEVSIIERNARVIKWLYSCKKYCENSI